MNLSSFFLISIITFIAILLCIVLINRKKRSTTIFLGIMLLFNFFSIINLINSFRRDYSQDLSIFPLGLYITLLVSINIIFNVLRVIMRRKLERFGDDLKNERIIKGFYSLRERIFKFENKKDSIISSLLIFCLICGINFYHTFWHELSHAISAILFGGYFGRIDLDFYTFGTTYGIGGVAFNNIQYFFIYFAGLLGEIIFGVFLLSISRVKLRERSKFNDLLFILIYLIFIVGGLGYFSIPVLFNIVSDSFYMAQIINIPPLIIFLISFPFFLISLVLAYRLLVRFYRDHFKPRRRFFFILSFSCLMFITFFTVFLIIDFYLSSIEPVLVIT